MNISSGLAIHTCTSCQMCGAVCPTNAITINFDDEGFYRPTICEDKCIDCGKCVTVCYKYDREIKLTSKEQLSQCEHYSAAAKDDSIVCETTSGGVADILACFFIRERYKVIGVMYDTASDRAIHKIAATTEETVAFRGSKYLQSYTFDAFRELIKECDNQRFAVFGLPCQIYAINRYLESINQRSRCVLIDLYCHGCPSMLVWRKITAELHDRIGKEQFRQVVFRSKKKGWGQFVLQVKSVNGKEFISSPMDNDFYDMFFSNQLLNESCNDCELRSTINYTDIRLGDYWGKEFRHNRRGVSGVTLVTPTGRDCFSRIKSKLVCEKRPLEKFLGSQSWGVNYKVDKELRACLLKNLKDSTCTIHDVMSPLVQRTPFISRLKRIIKAMVYNDYVAGFFI